MSWGYQFFHFLFPSLLQGDNAPQSIIGQLKRIKKVMHHFDVVVIVRGGGGDIGLSCFNNYELAKAIAMFPIPVITGIGHATNETVTEMVAFTNAITPTKIAEFLIQKFHDFSVPIQNAEEKILDKAKRLITDERNKFTSEIKLFRSVTTSMLLKNSNILNDNAKSLIFQSQFIFKNEYEHHKMAKQKIMNATKTLCNSLNQGLLQNEKNIKKDILLLFRTWHLGIENIEKNIHNMSPENVLKRGYSITYLNGKSVSTFKDLKEGDLLKTTLNEGSVTSIVNKISNNE